MKHTVILLLLLSNTTFSQDNCKCKDTYTNPTDVVNPSRIVYDFKCKKLYKNDIEGLKKGDFYQIEVNNINLNLYRVTVSYRDSTLYEQKDFSKLITGIGDASKLIDGIITNTKSELLDTLEVESVFKDDNPRQVTVKDEINAYSKKANAQIEQLKVIKLSLDSLLVGVNDKLKKSLSTCGSTINFSFIEAFLDKQNSILEKTSTISSVLKTLKKELSELKEKNIQAIKVSQELQDLIKNLESKMDEMKIVISQIQANFTSEKINKIVNQLYDVINNSENAYRTLPIQLIKDFSKVELEIAPIDSASRLPSYKTQIAFPLNRKWYLSVGPSIYGSYLNDEAYSLFGSPVNDSTSQFTLVQERSNNLEIGGSVLVSGGYKWWDVFGVHGVIGTGFSFTETVRPRLMLGAGISLGRKHNLAINYGMIAGYVNKLSNAYSIGNNYNADSQPLVSVLVAKSFVSLGYIFKF